MGKRAAKVSPPAFSFAYFRKTALYFQHFPESAAQFLRETNVCFCPTTPAMNLHRAGNSLVLYFSRRGTRYPLDIRLFSPELSELGDGLIFRPPINSDFANYFF
jgi:hypothetical protein